MRRSGFLWISADVASVPWSGSGAEMQAMNVKYEISPYMTCTKDVVSLSERKKERSEVSPKVEKRKSKGGRGRRKGIPPPSPSLILEKGSERVFSSRLPCGEDRA